VSNRPLPLLQLLLVVLALTTRVSLAQSQSADLVLRNGDVWTVDSLRPRGQAIAIRGDRILAVGSNAEIDRLVGPATKVIDLKGRLATPGFIEGHGHFESLGESKMVLDLTTARTWDDIVAQVGAAVKTAQAGALISGRGWHQEKWTRVPEPSVDGVPLHASLDQVSPNNPVILGHASGHASFVNGAALRLAGITRDTPNPPGGEIVKDAAGNPTGLLRETAQRLMSAARAKLPRSTRAEQEARFRKAVQLAGDEALSHGVTAFHDAGSSFATIDAYKRLAEEGTLPVRLYVMVRNEADSVLDARLPQYRLIDHANGMLTVRSIKQQIDGALGPHGAWLLEPYADLTSSSGLNLKPIDAFERTARIAIKHGFQINTHAIGDRANREMLDVYERVFRDHPDKRDLRWRDEHTQHVDPTDVARFKKLGVIASMQGIHTISDGPWVAKRLGEERTRRTSYLWRSLLDAGVVVTNGTDVPVERIDPIASFWGSVARRTADGSVFLPEQRVTREEALRAYTLSNAYAAFAERSQGSLTPGKYADIVVLSRNIMTSPEAEIPSARVDLTILGGKIRYERPVIRP
jgi:predicted amidohydrolase YtcJ